MGGSPSKVEFHNTNPDLIVLPKFKNSSVELKYRRALESGDLLKTENIIRFYVIENKGIEVDRDSILYHIFSGRAQEVINDVVSVLKFFEHAINDDYRGHLLSKKGRSIKVNVDGTMVKRDSKDFYDGEMNLWMEMLDSTYRFINFFKELNSKSTLNVPDKLMDVHELRYIFDPKGQKFTCSKLKIIYNNKLLEDFYENINKIFNLLEYAIDASAKIKGRYMKTRFRHNFIGASLDITSKLTANDISKIFYFHLEIVKNIFGRRISENLRCIEGVQIRSFIYLKILAEINFLCLRCCMEFYNQMGLAKNYFSIYELDSEKLFLNELKSLLLKELRNVQGVFSGNMYTLISEEDYKDSKYSIVHMNVELAMDVEGKLRNYAVSNQIPNISITQPEEVKSVNNEGGARRRSWFGLRRNWSNRSLNSIEEGNEEVAHSNKRRESDAFSLSSARSWSSAKDVVNGAMQDFKKSASSLKGSISNFKDNATRLVFGDSGDVKREGGSRRSSKI